MSATAEAPPGPEVWQAQNLRLTAFSQSPQFAVPQQWWREVTSSEPEHVLEKRPKQEREEAGLFQGAVFGLAFDILRVQWTAAPRLDAENIDLNNQPATLGQFIERKDWFHRLMEGWLPRCPPIHRLAFGANLLLPVENHEAGYRMLDRYLRWLEIDPQSSEILYRVNRRRPSGTGVQGLMLNRLSTWVVGKFAVVVRVIEGAHPEHQIQPTERYAVALELDINTTPDYQGLLPHPDLPRIFAELVDGGVEIATRGDAR